MKNLAKKMVKILGAVSGKVAKSGKNSHQGYNYVMEADLLDAVRAEIIANGVFIFSSTEETAQEGKLTTVKTKHTFVDAESGEMFDVFSSGQGSDGQDKGVYKAITGASKYFLMKNFMVAGDDDPEGANASTPSTGKVPTKGPKKSPPPKKSGGFGKASANSGFGKVADKVSEAPIDPALDDIPF